MYHPNKAKASLKPKTKKNEMKKKSQLELFKEEIKAKHDASEAMKAEAKKKAELTGQSLIGAQHYLPAAVSDQVKKSNLLIKLKLIYRAIPIHQMYSLHQFIHTSKKMTFKTSLENLVLWLQ